MVSCGYVLAYTKDSLFFIYLHNRRNFYFVRSGNDALRFDDLGLLD